MTAPLKADTAAAERLLKAAVKRAREVITAAPFHDAWGFDYDIAYVEAMLRAAAESAELLLGADR